MAAIADDLNRVAGFGADILDVVSRHCGTRTGSNVESAEEISKGLMQGTCDRKRCNTELGGKWRD